MKNPPPVTNSSAQIPLWKTIRWRLILNSILIAVLPIILVTTVILTRLRSQAQEQAFRHLQSVAQIKQEQINNWLLDSQILLDTAIVGFRNQGLNDFLILDSSSPTYSAIQNGLDSFLIQTVATQSNFDYLFFYTPDGSVVLSSDLAQFGKVVANRPYFNISLEQAHIQVPYYDLGTSELAMIITQVISDEETGEVLGVFAGSLNLDTLGEIMLERAGLGNSGETYLVSLESQYLLTPSRFESDGFPQNRAYRSEGINTVINGQDGLGEYTNYRGAEVFGVYRWIPQLEAGLLAEVDKAEALQSFGQAQAISATLVLVILGIAIGVGLYIANRISNPITSLTQTAISISEGNLDERSLVFETNEIGLLATVFNTMTEQLQNLIGHLEQRVLERTQRLKAVSELGGKLNASLEIAPLLDNLVSQIAETFDYYHVHIYLLDPTERYLVVQAGTGEAGAQMVENNHQVSLANENSIVAQAAQLQKTINVANVADNDRWLPNALLPRTQSEMAIPIATNKQLYGVFDVQSEQLEGIDSADADLLYLLANHVAVAIANMQSFKNLQEAKDLAEMTNELRIKFLSTMTHELRTPLNGIINMTGFVVDGEMGEINQEQKEALQITIDNGHHLLSLVNDTLDLTKIEAGMMQIHLTEVDLVSILNDVNSLAIGLAKDKPIKIIRDCPDNLPTVIGNQRRLEQILFNLVANAVKYTDEGFIKIHAEATDSDICIAIQDTGIGIAPEHYDSVFRPYAQAQQRETVVGTGLGLSIAKELVKLHNGEIWFESQVDHGTIFHIRLPLSQKLHDQVLQ